jgi:hypothetical protein
LKCLPKRGTASDVAGIVSATMLRKTVRDNKIVTPVEKTFLESAISLVVF